jgi:hypothetical protein
MWFCTNETELLFYKLILFLFLAMWLQMLKSFNSSGILVRVLFPFINFVELFDCGLCFVFLPMRNFAMFSYFYLYTMYIYICGRQVTVFWLYWAAVDIC